MTESVNAPGASEPPVNKQHKLDLCDHFCLVHSESVIHLHLYQAEEIQN